MLYRPDIVGRMSRGREGLPKSYHGNEAQSPDDFVGHAESGADAWTYVSQEGFSRVEIHAVECLAAIALVARKGSNAWRIASDAAGC